MYSKLTSHLILVLVVTLHVASIARAGNGDDCVPITDGAYHNADAQACCALSPFNKICTASQGSNVVMTSYPATDLLAQAPHLLEHIPEHQRAAAIASLDQGYEVVLNKSHTSESFYIPLGGSSFITGSYTLTLFNDPQQNFAVNGDITVLTSQCEVQQLVGSLGVPAQFADATCVQICDSSGECSPWSYCGLVHKDYPGAAWFGITIGERLFLLQLFDQNNKKQDFYVSLFMDCLTPGDSHAWTTGTTVLENNPEGGYELVVNSMEWYTEISIHSAGPKVVLQFGGTNSSRIIDDKAISDGTGEEAGATQRVRSSIPQRPDKK